jgi:ATP-binding cassette subfamily B (MDR/TAP) protein 1
MTFEKVVNMEIEWFDHPENSSGAIGARLSADAAKVRGLVGDALQLVVQNSSTLVAGLVIAFVSNWELSLIILALIPLIGLNGWIQMKFIQGFSADAKVCSIIPNCLCLRFIVSCIELHSVICECR